MEEIAGNDIKYFESTVKNIYNGALSPAEEMHKLANTGIDYSLSENLALNWAQITEMIDSGLCTVGSHTCRHCSLTKVDNEVAKEELIKPKEFIERNILNYKVNLFSYPHSMTDEEIEGLVKSSGFQYAFLGHGGKIRSGDNPYLLNRRYIVQQ